MQGIISVQHTLAIQTAVLTKVVPQKRKSVRGNADWHYG